MPELGRKKCQLLTITGFIDPSAAPNGHQEQSIHVINDLYLFASTLTQLDRDIWELDGHCRGAA